MAEDNESIVMDLVDLIESAFDAVNSAMDTVTTLTQENANAAPLLVTIASRLSIVRDLLQRLLKSAEYPCDHYLGALYSDLESCAVSSHLLADRLVLTARITVASRQGNKGRRASLWEGALQEGDVAGDFEALRYVLTQALTACDCNDLRRSQTAARGCRPPRLFSRVQLRIKAGTLPLRLRRRIMQAVGTMSSTLSNLKGLLPTPSLTPRCVANRRVATEARRRSQFIDEQIEAAKSRTSCAVPLAGPDDLKALVLEHFVSRTPDEQLDETLVTVGRIQHNVLRHVHRLMSKLHGQGFTLLDDNVKALIYEIQIMAEQQSSSGFDSQFVEYLRSLWSNPTVRAVSAGNQAFGDFVVEAVERTSQPAYTPTSHDYQRFAVDRCYSFHQGSFGMDGLTIEFLNARHQHRKQLRLHANFPCVIYLVNLDGYCQYFDEPTDNELNMALLDFGATFSSKTYSNASAILVLSNLAAFTARLPTKPLSRYMPEYSRDGDSGEAVDFVMQKFVNAKPADMELYVHVGEMTDSSLFDFTAGAIKDSLIRRP